MNKYAICLVVDLVAALLYLFRQSVLRHEVLFCNCQTVLHLVLRTGMGQLDGDVVRQVVLRQRVTHRISLLDSTTGNTADVLHPSFIFQCQTSHIILVITVSSIAVTDTSVKLKMVTRLNDLHLVFAHRHREREFAVGAGHHHLVVLHNRAAVNGEHSSLDRIGTATVNNSTANVERTVVHKVHRMALRLGIDKPNLTHRRELVRPFAWHQIIGSTITVIRNSTNAVRTVGIGHTFVRKLRSW